MEIQLACLQLSSLAGILSILESFRHIELIRSSGLIF